METESNLKVGGKYLYWSRARKRRIQVVYVGKRHVPGSVFVFQDPSTLNEYHLDKFEDVIPDGGFTVLRA